MGNYLNPDNEAFLEAIDTEIYVDKSELIIHTNKVIKTMNKHICVSRPRRFGKSTAADMLVAYYSRGCDSRELFSKLKISQHPNFEKHLNKYNVIHIVIQDFFNDADTVEDMIAEIENTILYELKIEYKDVNYYNDKKLYRSLQDVYTQTNIPFIFIIDEWDCIFRLHRNDIESQKTYLDFLCELFKGKKYIALSYMTGILPIKKYGRHSALNMFDEYSMIEPEPFEEFVGFTENEVKKLCDDYSLNFDEMKLWYDGYNLNGISIYNPKSVVLAILKKKFRNYWTKTETYEALKVYIKTNSFDLKAIVTNLIGGAKIKINPDKFQNDMVTFKSSDDILALLVHLGYLTYDSETNEVWIPNNEVQKEFINSIEDGGWENVMDAIRKSDDLIKATLAMNEEKVAEYVEEAHRENTSILKYNDENSLSCVLSLAYYSARNNYVIYRELAGGNGFADLVFVPRKECSTPAFIVELKWDKSAETAITQIKQKKYTECLKDYSGEILLVGINYDKEDKVHTCQIEKVVK